MASTSEVGHAKNVANLQKLTEQVTVYPLYNPPVDSLKIPNLKALHAAASAKLAEVEEKRSLSKNAIAARQAAFENLKPTATKILNHLEILGLPAATLAQARTLNRAIQGGQKKTAAPEAPKPLTGTTPPTPARQISTSRQSYTQLTDNFASLLQLLETLPAYGPNEDHLKRDTLAEYRETLLAATKSVDQTEAALSHTIMERDQILYAEGTGLYSIALNVKKYIKSLYGATSPEFAAVTSIEFTTRK